MSSLGILLFVLLSTVAAGAVAYAFMQPKMANSKRVKARKTAYSRDEAARARVGQMKDRMQEQAKRRRVLQSNLKDLESRTKARGDHGAKPSLEHALKQCGLKITPTTFHLFSGGGGIFVAFVCLMFGLPLLVCAGLGIVGAFGLPRLFLANRRKKRLKDFSNHFPTAIDLIVRGVKAGLPLNDTLRNVVSDVPEPVAGEFQRIIETQQLGIPIGEACERLHRHVPLPETNFFSIVIAIQSQAGGNLSEALGNLSRVLRERKKMRQKVEAVSMEAKVSAGIIGVIPFFVAGMIYVTSPDYMAVLVQDPRGNLVLIGAGIWMLIGILIMKKMINFDV
ncbi:type II secretion system F family protein [Fulvimarina sp. 2208YS6-2-32]|uniref:Type II secretion system F family protein n=1 Tax=Fulvimarina uroteuthidis TaxID=3098149 RepID=A0ABU5HZ96_9HYPH|nr:type II secretion system F family protein [Fulvimarina sp. 2208YS6-2-32]MDY8108449.1 type II secretion system F family protein [Fulvimarina sp. 2208YS6-2-32]